MVEDCSSGLSLFGTSKRRCISLWWMAYNMHSIYLPVGFFETCVYGCHYKYEVVVPQIQIPLSIHYQKWQIYCAFNPWRLSGVIEGVMGSQNALITRPSKQEAFIKFMHHDIRIPSLMHVPCFPMPSLYEAASFTAFLTSLEAVGFQSRGERQPKGSHSSTLQ